MHVLAAVSLDNVARLSAVMHSYYSLTYPMTVERAIAYLDTRRFDMIVCDCRFDESRQVDLLRHCKTTPALAPIPFLCIRLARGQLNTDTFTEMATAVRSLGAHALDLSGLLDNDDEESAALQFQELVAAVCPSA